MAALEVPCAVGSPAGGEGWQIVGLDGDIDLATAPVMASALVASARRLAIGVGLAVDLSHVDFIDSTGLAALVGTRNDLRRCGRDLVLRTRHRR